MSSHREAPEISKDPVADSTDVYAFVSPDKPDTVTLIANYIPLQKPAGGPNFYEFGDDVLYEIHIANDGDGKADITYQFRFTTRSATRRRSSTTPARSTDSTTRTGTASSSTRSPGSRPATAEGARRSLPARRQRRARCTPNYAAARRPGDAHARAAARSSPASAPTVLRRPRLHLRPRYAAAVQEAHLISMPATDGRQRACRPSTCTRSRSRCRSRT